MRHKFILIAALTGSALTGSAARLPAGYQEVEYVQSTGQQFVDTGIAPKPNHEYQFKFAMMAAKQYGHAFGTKWNGGSTYRTRVIFNNTSTTDFMVDFRSRNSVTVNNVVAAVGETVEGALSATSIDLNGKSGTISAIQDNVADTLTLMGIADLSQEWTSVRFWYFRILEDGVVKHEYVPCYQVDAYGNPGVIGFYDIVGGDGVGSKFYAPPVGMPPLVKGPDVFYPDALTVTAEPENVGVVSPDYGANPGYVPGQSVTCTASTRAVNATGVELTCTGVKVLTNGVTVAAKDFAGEEERALTFDFPDCKCGATVVWVWQRDDGSVSVALDLPPEVRAADDVAVKWVLSGEDAEFAVTVDEGYAITSVPGGTYRDGKITITNVTESVVAKVDASPRHRDDIAVFSGGLPAEYRQVEYVQSTGGQFIDTGVVPKPNHEYQFKFAMMAAKQYGHAFGTKWNGGSTYRARVIFNNASTTDFMVDFRSKNSVAVNNVVAALGETVEGALNATRVVLNGKSGAISPSQGDVSDTLTLMGIADLPQEWTSVRFWYFRILEGDKLKHEYMPCCLRADPTKVGLYDVVDRKFLTAEGLQAGPEVSSAGWLVVEGEPFATGTVEPAYGVNVGYWPGDAVTCTAQTHVVSAESGEEWLCTGVKVLANGVTLAAKDFAGEEVRALTFGFPDCEYGAKVVWIWREVVVSVALDLPDEVQAEGGVMEKKVRSGEDAEFAVTVDEGYAITSVPGGTYRNGKITITNVMESVVAKVGASLRHRDDIAVFSGDLPAVYRQVEYVQSTGQQFIDTGIVPKWNHEYQFKFAVMTQKAYGNVFGVKWNNGDTYRMRVVCPQADATSFIADFRTKNGGASAASIDHVVTELGDAVEGTMNAEGISLNGRTETFGSGNRGDVSDTLTLMGIADLPQEWTSVRFWYFRILEGGKLKHEYMPCCLRADPTKVGLYDVVGRKFLTAEGLQAGPAMSGCLTVAGEPSAVGAVEPAYGVNIGYWPGEEVSCTLPSAITTNATEDAEMTCTGVSAVADGVTIASRSFLGDEPRTMTFAWPSRETSVRLVWRWQGIAYRVSVVAPPDLVSVSPAEQWVLPGETAEFDVTCVPGFVITSVTGGTYANGRLTVADVSAPVEVTISSGHNYYVGTEGTDDDGCGDEETPFATIEYALAKASGGDVVFVGAGTFTPTNALALPAGVIVKGAGTNKTFVVGGAVGENRLFTLSGADSALQSLTVSNCAHGAVGMSAGVVSNCVFGDNAAADGGAIAVDGGDGVTIRQCVFSGNSAARGGAVFAGSSALVEDCEFTGNTASGNFGEGGAAILVNATSKAVTIRRCLFDRNLDMYGGSCGGAIATRRGSLLVECCVICHNLSTGGSSAGISLKSDSLSNGLWPTVRNCLICGNTNTTSNAGGLLLQNVNCCAYNNTIVGNVCAATEEKSGVVVLGGTFKNNIVWGNGTGPDSDASTVSSGTVANNILDIATAAAIGTGNSCVDPKFKSPKKGNFRLAPDSPAVNAGDNTIWSGDADPVDLDGQPRIDRSKAVDIGCYEGVRRGLVIFLQ